VARQVTYRERRIRGDADGTDGCHYVHTNDAPEPKNSSPGGSSDVSRLTIACAPVGSVFGEYRNRIDQNYINYRLHIAGFLQNEPNFSQWNHALKFSLVDQWRAPIARRSALRLHKEVAARALKQLVSDFVVARDPAATWEGNRTEFRFFEL